MLEKNNLFLEGIRGEMGELIHSCIDMVRVTQRQVDSTGSITAEDVKTRGDRMIKLLTQLDYLKSDYADLFYSREPGFELSLELMNISEQLELIRSGIQEQVMEKGWDSRLVLESAKPLYADMNPGYFYTACANITANLYYYAAERKDIHILVTEDRTVDISMEGTRLPEMVIALAEEYGETDEISRVGIGTYGLLFAVQFCRAMNWKISFEDRADGTHVLLRAPMARVLAAPREQLASGMAQRVLQQNQINLRVKRAFGVVFAE